MLKIMVIDDDSDDRFFFREAVACMGEDYSFIEASSGIDALKHLISASDLPDVIFLDLNMPKMDGKEFLLELKNDSRLKHIVVIIYTTSTYSSDVDYLTKIGAANFFIKSTDTSEIQSGIIHALDICGLSAAI